MKKNIGAQLALYPAPVIVVGAIVNDKPTWTLVAHAGTMAHSHLMVSLVHAHYINQEIIESKKLSVNIVDEAWLKETDRMGVISGNKEDKSESGKIDYHTFKPVLFEYPTYEYFVTGEKVGDCANLRQAAEVSQDHRQSAAQVQQRHHRYQHRGDLRDTADAAQ